MPSAGDRGGDVGEVGGQHPLLARLQLHPLLLRNASTLYPSNFGSSTPTPTPPAAPTALRASIGGVGGPRTGGRRRFSPRASSTSPAADRRRTERARHPARRGRGQAAQPRGAWPNGAPQQRWTCRGKSSGAGPADPGAGHGLAQRDPAGLERPATARRSRGGRSAWRGRRAGRPARAASSSQDSPACRARSGSSRSQAAARRMSSASARSRSYWRHWRAVLTRSPFTAVSMAGRSGGSRASSSMSGPARHHPADASHLRPVVVAATRP